MVAGAGVKRGARGADELGLGASKASGTRAPRAHRRHSDAGTSAGALRVRESIEGTELAFGRASGGCERREHGGEIEVLENSADDGGAR